ncbi:hypothetical protein FOZ63_016507 [Perkinsus olseni]|uniref:UDP-N-acetylglucosamine transporter n=3 Tax=Perkinsus olseni TaxID=32597 RepID=A0A7J6U158_PEROL|nr:hypothetical protein FOZ63_016507 [Perkinsus olseni]
MALSSSGEQPNSEEAPFARRALVAVVVLLALALCFVLALINTFIHHEQQHHHTFYGTNKYIVVTLAEGIKLTCCICVYLATTREATPSDGSNPGSRYGLTTVVRYTGFKEALAYCVPAVVYLVENNSIFVALDLLDSSATFQLLLNIKIVITALLFRYFLGRSLSMSQFICTVLCAVGLCIAVVASGTEEEPRNDVDNADTGGSSRWVRTMLGAGVVFAIALVASFSNIWVEYLFQDRDSEIPFLLRNSRIYMWGAPLNSVAVMAAAVVTGEMPTVEALRAGLVTAVGLSVVGLATAVILNYGNNMINAYLHAGTLICTVVVSAVLYSDYTKINSPWFLLGAVLVSASAIGYRLGAAVVARDEPTYSSEYSKVGQPGRGRRLSTISEGSDEESGMSVGEIE